MSKQSTRHRLPPLPRGAAWLGSFCAALLLAAPLALAQPEIRVDTEYYERTGRFYAAFTGGATFPNNPDLDSVLNTPVTDLQLELDDGYVVTGALGVDFHPLRFEGEVAYRTSEADTITPFTNAAIDGDLDTWSGMANLYYDFRLHDAFSLYVGGGAGLARTEVEGSTEFFFVTDDIEGTDTVLALQAMAGAAVHLNENFAITIGYRIFGHDKLDLGEIETDQVHLVHSVEAGIRITF